MEDIFNSYPLIEGDLIILNKEEMKVIMKRKDSFIGREYFVVSQEGLCYRIDKYGLRNSVIISKERGQILFKRLGRGNEIFAEINYNSEG